MIAGLAAAAAAALNVPEAALADAELDKETALLDNIVLEDSLASLEQDIALVKKQAVLAGAKVQESAADEAKSKRPAAEKAELEVVKQLKEVALRIQETEGFAAKVEKAAVEAKSREIISAVKLTRVKLQQAATSIASAKAYAVAAAKALPRIEKEAEKNLKANKEAEKAQSTGTDGKPKKKIKNKKAAAAVAVVSAGKAVVAFGEAEANVKAAIKATNKPAANMPASPPSGLFR